MRTDRSSANMIDIYGLRPLQHPWYLLCPYEFLRYWAAEPLLAPTAYRYKPGAARTAWTPAGDIVRKSDAYKQDQVVLKPGIHYTVIEPETTAFFQLSLTKLSKLSDMRGCW